MYDENKFFCWFFQSNYGFDRPHLHLDSSIPNINKHVMILSKYIIFYEWINGIGLISFDLFTLTHCQVIKNTKLWWNDSKIYFYFEQQIQSR